MSEGRRKVISCDACRKKHTRCEKLPSSRNNRNVEKDSTCIQCHRDNISCTRTKRRLKFTSTAGIESYDRNNYLAAEARRKSSKPLKEIVYIDETTELNAAYGNSDDREKQSNDTQGSYSHLTWTEEESAVPDAETTQGVEGLLSPETRTDASIFNHETISLAKQSESSSHQRAGSWVPDYSAMPYPGQEPDYRCTGNPVRTMVNKTDSDTILLEGLIRFANTEPTLSRLEFILLQYYMDVLSGWLDFCDPYRHFRTVVTQRARKCVPLMNAIFASSARHLTQVPKYRTASGVLEYAGHRLDDLTNEMVIYYHNKCINDFLKFEKGSTYMLDEDLFAAAILLRFYEEIDYPLQDHQMDNELFLGVTNVFIKAQIPMVTFLPLERRHPEVIDRTGGYEDNPSDANNSSHTSPDNSTITTISGTHIPTQSYLHDTFNVMSPYNITSSPSQTHNESKSWYMSDLRQAAFWVAFRQEVYTSFLKQRPFNMSLARCDVYRSFEPAEDALWAARLIIFCADVLSFCYGNSASDDDMVYVSGNETNSHQQKVKERWIELKEIGKVWARLLPSSFAPTYSRKPDRRKGEVFPEISYLTSYHIAGVQHVELANILLAVYDPTRPKLGFGHVASMRALSWELKASVSRICGIAIGNRSCPPALTTAFLGIVVCGEHFEDSFEQEALLTLLDELECDHGWPVSKARDKLKESWGWVA